MARLVFLFAFAFIALQVCSGAAVRSPRNEMDDVVNQFLAAMNEANRLSFFADDELSSMVHDFDTKIDRILEEKSGYPILENLKTSITKTESDISENSNNCIDSAWRLTKVAMDELKRGTDNCASEANTASSETRTEVSNFGKKAINFRERVVIGMHECMSIGEDVDETNFKCLDDLIKVLNKELAELEVEVDTLEKSVIRETENGLEKSNVCLDQAKEDISLKSETILGSLNQCKQQNVASFKIAHRGITDIIKDLKAKIEKIVEIISLLPTSIDQIPDKIQELISHLNIVAITKQLEIEINQIINDGGRDAEKCRPSAEKKLQELLESSQEDAKVCMDATDDDLQAIKSQIIGLLDEAKALLRDFNKQVLDCTKENILSPIGFAKCIQSHYDEYKQKVADLQKRVTDAVESVTKQTDEIMKDVARCVNKVQVDTVEGGQALIKSVEKCVISIH